MNNDMTKQEVTHRQIELLTHEMNKLFFSYTTRIVGFCLVNHMRVLNEKDPKCFAYYMKLANEMKWFEDKTGVSEITTPQNTKEKEK